MSGKTSNSDVEWRLAGQIQQPQGSPAIEIHRPLTQAELTELDEAAEIINRLSANDTYARAVQLLDVAERQHESQVVRDRPAPPAALGPLAAAIGAVCAALTEVPTDLLAQAQRDLSQDQYEDLAATVAELGGSSRWRGAISLATVMGDRRANLAVRGGALHLTDAANAKVKAKAGVDVGDAAVIERLRDAALVAQQMTAHRFLAYRELLVRHALFVRRLAAEVPLGAPVAFLSVAAEDAQSSNVSFKPFPLDRIVALYVAIRQSEQLLAEVSKESPDDEVRRTGEDGAGAAASQQSESDEANSGTGGPEAEGEQDDEGDQGAEPEGGGHEGVRADAGDDDGDGANDASDSDGAGAQSAPDTVPLDFASLVSFAERLPSEVERAWSQALDQVGLDEAHAELSARWQSVLVGAARMAQRDEAESAAAGVDARLPFMPGDPRALEALDLDGDAQSQWVTATLGQMTGLEALVKSLQRLMSRGCGEPLMRSPDDPSWWESGAFAETRGRGFGLRRLTTEVDLAQRAKLSDSESAPAVPPLARWADRFRLAEDASDRGDWEASVIHLWVAVRERASQLAGVPLAEVPDDFEERVAADPEVAEMASGFTLLRDLAHRALAADPAPLAFYVLAATILIEPLHRVCSGLSQILPLAARQEPPAT